jgi:hypothetical protein
MENQTNGKAIASLILGTLSLVFIFIFPQVGWIGILLGIVGLILGIIANKERRSGMGTAGIVLSAIGIGVCVIGLIACVACASYFGGLLGTAAMTGF